MQAPSEEYLHEPQNRDADADADADAAAAGGRLSLPAAPALGRLIPPSGGGDNKSSMPGDVIAVGAGGLRQLHHLSAQQARTPPSDLFLSLSLSLFLSLARSLARSLALHSHSSRALHANIGTEFFVGLCVRQLAAIPKIDFDAPARILSLLGKGPTRCERPMSNPPCALHGN
eukprot:COSAG05_NODE_2863_length_2558_cov_3.866612_3_plen_173_part_00